MHVPALALVALLLLSVVALLELGRWFGLVRRRVGGIPDGIGPLEAAAFGLLTLLIAFTFNGAASRYDVRRQQIVQEVNALGTAWLRIDLLPPAAQPAVRERFRAYLDHRIAMYRAMPDLAAARPHLDSAAHEQSQLWTLAVSAAQQSANPAAAVLLLPPLNESFDVATTRLAAMRMHPPAIVWIALFVLTAVCCLLAGFDMSASARSWFHIGALAVLFTVTIYLILDFELPRVGLIRLASFDQLLIDLRAQLR